MMERGAIEKRLEELRGELGRVEGGPTEVYSRIVGYYRSVRNWNAGKREEYAARRVFSLPSARDKRREGAPVTAEAEILVFTRKACPNCPPVASHVRASGLAAAFVDVDGEEGLALARSHGVLATPTVLALDPQGRELFRACDLSSLRSALSARRA
ncbi:MAG: anaerobic ribonucleoside-triphosphate reductase [Rectinemataceae bacterium]